MRILVANGPNLNLLGQRDPERYGHRSLGELEEELHSTFPEVELLFMQSNHEGVIIDRLHAAPADGIQGVILNPAALTFTSLAVREAVKAIPIPVIEVHLTNLHDGRGERASSVVASACWGQISGFGFLSYHLAVRALLRRP